MLQLKYQAAISASWLENGLHDTIIRTPIFDSADDAVNWFIKEFAPAGDASKITCGRFTLKTKWRKIPVKFCRSLALEDPNNNFVDGAGTGRTADVEYSMSMQAIGDFSGQDMMELIHGH